MGTPRSAESVATAPALPESSLAEPSWPNAGEEESCLAATPVRIAAAPPPREVVAGPSGGVGLPALEELVERIPSGLRGVLDDLFRARFTAVRKIAPPELRK